MPSYHPISVSGYHIREAGSTARRSSAFTLADGFAYVELGLERGLDINVFGPQLSFFFNSHIDFFEEIAKFRAARRIGPLDEGAYGATDPKAMMCRFHVQTAGCSLTLQQPYNNVVRTALEALAAVLGGAQSLLPTRSMRCTRCRPRKGRDSSPHAAGDRARDGCTTVIDPLGGSHFLEALTDRIEEEAEELLQADREDRRRLDARGLFARHRGRLLPDGIAEAAYRQQKRFDAER